MASTDPIILFVNGLGWLGALLFLAAYFLFSSGRLAGDSRVYQLMNLFGGVFLIVNALYYRAFPSAGVNFAWAVITIMAMLRKSRASNAEVMQ